MDYSKAGIILNTGKYPECVKFYGEVVGLETLYEIDRPGEKLTCFDLGGVYLMVEPGGISSPIVKTTSQCPTKFRFNVADVEAVCADLETKGVELEIRQHPWGTVAEFSDPDGNRCALRSDEGFGAA